MLHSERTKVFEKLGRASTHLIGSSGSKVEHVPYKHFLKPSKKSDLFYFKYKAFLTQHVWDKTVYPDLHVPYILDVLSVTFKKPTPSTKKYPSARPKSPPKKVPVFYLQENTTSVKNTKNDSL